MKTLQTVVATHNDAEGPEPVNTVLVAGGAGFLGSHLCERLLVEGRRVICVDVPGWPTLDTAVISSRRRGLRPA